MLPRLVAKSWAHISLLPQPPKYLGPEARIRLPDSLDMKKTKTRKSFSSVKSKKKTAFLSGRFFIFSFRKILWCVCIWGAQGGQKTTCRSRFSFHREGSTAHTQVLWLGDKSLDLPHHLASPESLNLLMQ